MYAIIAGQEASGPVMELNARRTAAAVACSGNGSCRPHPETPAECAACPEGYCEARPAGAQ